MIHSLFFLSTTKLYATPQNFRSQRPIRAVSSRFSLAGFICIMEMSYLISIPHLRVARKRPSENMRVVHSYPWAILHTGSFYNYFIYLVYGFFYLLSSSEILNSSLRKSPINDWMSGRLRLRENLEFESSSHKNCGGSFFKNFEDMISLLEFDCSFSGLNLSQPVIWIWSENYDGCFTIKWSMLVSKVWSQIL